MYIEKYTIKITDNDMLIKFDLLRLQQEIVFSNKLLLQYFTLVFF